MSRIKKKLSVVSVFNLIWIAAEIFPDFPYFPVHQFRVRLVARWLHAFDRPDPPPRFCNFIRISPHHYRDGCAVKK
jgi:hypothetical protein